MDLISNKALEIGDKITFYLGDTLVDGVIEEKNILNSSSDIDFAVKMDNGFMLRIKHRNLRVYLLHTKTGIPRV